MKTYFAEALIYEYFLNLSFTTTSLIKQAILNSRGTKKENTVQESNQTKTEIKNLTFTSFFYFSPPLNGFRGIDTAYRYYNEQEIGLAREFSTTSLFQRIIDYFFCFDHIFKTYSVDILG